MAFLSRPDESRLWLFVVGLLVLSMVLVLAALQFPWYTATYTVPGIEARGQFDFREAQTQVFYEGEILYDPPNQVYGDDSPFGELMGRTELLVGAGVVGVVAVAGLAYLHRSGRYSSPGLIKAAWIVGTGGLAAGLAYFTLNAGSAGADEVHTQLAALAMQVNDVGTIPGRPQPVFWGTQEYANGELLSAPGVGWLLAILALSNLVLATLLLYRFPAPREEAEAVAASFRVEEPRGEAATPAAPLAGEPRSGAWDR